MINSESPVRWRKSSYSGPNGGECVEVGEGFSHVVPVRDSKDAGIPALVFSRPGWAGFVSALHRGDLPG